MKIEIEHEGSCLGATGGTGRLIVRDALAKGHSVVVLVRSKARVLDLPGRSIAISKLYERASLIVTNLSFGEWSPCSAMPR